MKHKCSDSDGLLVRDRLWTETYPRLNVPRCPSLSNGMRRTWPPLGRDLDVHVLVQRVVRETADEVEGEARQLQVECLAGARQLRVVQRARAAALEHVQREREDVEEVRVAEVARDLPLATDRVEAFVLKGTITLEETVQRTVLDSIRDRSEPLAEETTARWGQEGTKNGTATPFQSLALEFATKSSNGL